MTRILKYIGIMAGIPLGAILGVGLFFALFLGHPTGRYYIDCSPGYKGGLDYAPMYRVMEEVMFRPDHCFYRTPDAGQAYMLYRDLQARVTVESIRPL